MDAAAPTLGLWACNLSRPLSDLDDWIESVDALMATAAAQGVDLLVLPEWVAAHRRGFAPADLAAQDEVAWMARFTAPALDRLASAAARRGVGLLAGTMPVAVAGAYVNRAHLLLPDGTRHAQDKLCLTPFERDPSGWTVEPGTRLTVIEWRGLRVAILICLDLEQPALAGRLQDLDLDLVLVPSMTDLPSGYRRVFNCARARAIELMCPVAVVGTLGTQVVNGRTDRNASGAGVFLPCEPGLGMTGVHSELPMATETDDDGPLLVARQVPVAACRILRRGGAEAWAGPWTADHVEFLHRSTPLSRLRQARR